MNKGDPGYVQAVVDQKDYNLDFTQQAFVKKNMGKMELVQLLQKAFKDPSLNERSVEYDELRKYVAKAKRDISKIDFTLDHISFIESNAGQMKPFELAKNIFPDRTIVPLSAETQLINKYLKAIGAIGSDEKESDEYRPPKAAASLARKINQADPSANFDANDLTPAQRKCVDALRSYLQSIRFCAFMKTYKEADERAIFEEEFVKATYDKADLNSEELNMFINLCMEYVNMHQIIRRKNNLEAKVNASLGEDEKLYMTYIELLSGYEKDLTNCKTQTKRLQEALSSTRAIRLKGLAEANESLSKFVEEWKSEEGRKRALKIAEAQNLLVKDQMDKLENMDEYMASIFGVGKEEILRN